MRKVLLVHISSSGCCNTLVTMLNNGDSGFPYCATPAFSTPAVWCRVFQSRVFSRPEKTLRPRVDDDIHCAHKRYNTGNGQVPGASLLQPALQLIRTISTRAVAAQ